MELKNGDYNLLFITVDSCRYDSALQAHTEFLTNSCSFIKGEAKATYTLPSHISYFKGILPNLLDQSYYLPGIKQIWRSGSAKKRHLDVGVYFSEKTIINYYINNNYQVLGAGGVSFFSDRTSNILPALFPTFYHFQKPSDVESKKNIPRSENQFPLANISLITQSIDKTEPYFFFINSPATHIPFDFPGCNVTEEFKEAVSAYYAVDHIKDYTIKENQHLTKSQVKLLHNSQIQALEWVDAQIEKLVTVLKYSKRPTLLLVLADHGEEFGEGGRYGHAHNHSTVNDVPIWIGVI